MVRVGWWKPILLLLLAALLFAGNSSGHGWGDDFSQYVHHAVNIVEGHPYADIGHIRNLTEFIGPDAYPPVFPLMLAPGYWLFGLDWAALKGVVIVCFCLSLYIITLLGGNRMRGVYEAGLILVLALNPYLWYASNRIQSDYPFLLFCLLTLVVLERRYAAARLQDLQQAHENRGLAIVLGLLLYLCYATREAGMVLVPVVICYEVLHFRKIRPVTVLALAILLLLSSLQHISLGDSAADQDMQQRIADFSEKYGVARVPLSHLQSIGENLSPASVARQAYRYAESMRGIWPANDSPAVQLAGWVAFLLATVFATAGYIQAVVRGPGVLELFVAGYLAMIVIFAGFQGARYLIPVIPLFFLYAFRLHGDLMSSHRRSMLGIAGLFLVATTVSYAAGFRLHGSMTIRGITDSQAQLFFEYVRNDTPGDSIFVFQKPRALSLLTGRTASAWPVGDRPEIVPEYMDVIGADYYVISNIDWTGNARPVTAPPHLPKRLTLDYANEYFMVDKLDAG